MGPMIKLFVTDIDNTLFDHRVGIPQANIEALLRLQKQGVRLCLASGRNLSAMRSVAKELRLAEHDGFLVACNGAVVARAKDLSLLVNDTMDVPLLHSLAERAEAWGVQFSLEQRGKLLYTRLDADIVYERDHCGFKIQPMRDWRSEILEPTAKLMLAVDVPEAAIALEKLKEEFRGIAEVERHGPYYADVMRLGNTKLSGVNAILKDMDIGLEEVAAIGDGENDRILLSRVGWSASPDNASNAIKALTDLVVASAAEGGVARFASLVLARNLE